MCACVCASMRVHVSVCMSVRVCVCVYMCLCMCLRECACICVYTCVCKCVCVYANVCVYACVQMCVYASGIMELTELLVTGNIKAIITSNGVPLTLLLMLVVACIGSHARPSDDARPCNGWRVRYTL